MGFIKVRLPPSGFSFISEILPSRISSLFEIKIANLFHNYLFILLYILLL